MFGLDPKAGARALVEEAGVVAVGAEVSGTADVDPQAITTSMIARQDVRRIVRYRLDIYTEIPDLRNPVGMVFFNTEKHPIRTIHFDYFKLISI